jgi:hypothetical protein
VSQHDWALARAQPAVSVHVGVAEAGLSRLGEMGKRGSSADTTYPLLHAQRRRAEDDS